MSPVPLPSRRPWRRPRTRLLVPLLLAVVVLVGCGGDDAEDDTPGDDAAATTDPVADPVIEVDDNVFVPEEVVVEVGTEVTWVWVGRAAHNVVGDDFESDIIVEGEFRHTFDEPGSFPYVCTLHPGMDGTITVVETD